MQNPPWSRDELILALDLYMRNRHTPPSQTSPETLALSRVLNAMGRKTEERSADFRNPSGVYMKMMNYCSLDPSYTATGKRGLNRIGKGDKLVWDDFSTRPEELIAAANAIRANVEEGAYLPSIELDEHMTEATEGRLLTRQHIQRERSRSLVEKKKSIAVRTNGKLECEVCGFDFGLAYGDRGKGFIEAHHTKPLATLTPGATTSIDDLTLLCANCHRMIHWRKPWLSVGELRDIILAGRRCQ